MLLFTRLLCLHARVVILDYCLHANVMRIHTRVAAMDLNTARLLCIRVRLHPSGPW